jgi:hypothetical protein
MLYRFGYDFASRLVHPMATDGLEDFYRITMLDPLRTFPTSDRSANTLLIGTIIVQEALNASSFRWRRVLFDFLDELRRGVETGSKDTESLRENWSVRRGRDWAR